ncbi:uncharacterized protein LOC112573123 [Pomacea canaliculata]|uniref:uncharacterized protein LOC112573123 n=1 Tax=Pomacea canaliculata TaxID=400727 RepID=UPI000D72F94E|nr:uncharacterized protein LOC112573123 [Pomacea canaliculata]
MAARRRSSQIALRNQTLRLLETPLEDTDTPQFTYSDAKTLGTDTDSAWQRWRDKEDSDAGVSDDPDTKTHLDAEVHPCVTKYEAVQVPELNLLLNSASSSESSSDIDLHVSGSVADISQTSDRLLQGFLYGSPKRLHEYLMDILSCPNNFGIFSSKNLKPECEKGIWHYRPGKEYIILKKLHGPESHTTGVYLCQDKHTKATFIMKRISKSQRRLIGIEFLCQHTHDFLPEVYGVYKEEDTICIFLEYIQGGALENREWNIINIKEFAIKGLCVIQYLHSFDLVHGDIKVANLMLRNNTEPNSLVFVDFESAKHPQYILHRGGHTLQYLPQWYKEIQKHDKFHPVMKTADLWAFACILISLIQPNITNDPEAHHRLHGPWSKELAFIKQKCKECRQQSRICATCHNQFLLMLENKGKDILAIHLKHLMTMSINDPDWCRLRKLLEYLTDVNDVANMTAEEALRIVEDLHINNGSCSS